MFAGEDDAEVGLGNVAPEGEEGAEGADGGGLRDGDGEGWSQSAGVRDGLAQVGFGLLSPATFLTNSCIVSSASAEDAREETDEKDEMLLERMLTVLSGLGLRCYVRRICAGNGGVVVCEVRGSATMSASVTDRPGE